MNSRYVPLSQEISGKMLLLTLQAKKDSRILSRICTNYWQTNACCKQFHVMHRPYILYKQKYNFKLWSRCYDF